jgi:hypothetical protein
LSGKPDTDAALPAGCSRRRALGLLALTCAGIVLLTLVPIPPLPVAAGGTDAVWVWHPTLQDMRAGKGFYDAVETHLRDHSYPLRPFYVWYLPGLLMFLQHLSDRLGQDTLLALYVVSTGVWLLRMRTLGGAILVVGVIPLCALSIHDSLWPLYDLWVGPLIALSLGLRPYNRTASVAIGLLPMFVRLHAGLFAVIMLTFALYERHRKEAVAWALGLALFGLQIAVHYWAVSARIAENDPLRKSVEPGLGFVIATMRCAPCFLWTVKDTFNGPILALVILGAWASRDPRVLAVLLGYFSAFLFIGHPINWYWGFMYAPLLSVGLAYAVPALAQLVRLSLPARRIMASTSLPARKTQAADNDQGRLT